MQQAIESSELLWVQHLQCQVPASVSLVQLQQLPPQLQLSVAQALVT
jgi:hypothetical protein